jgi:membrane-bound metal-dependent hydrolase YbcI (DUF457 family)
MTVYEHAMLGVNLSLFAGLRRRYGWWLVAVAGVAAALPDWDGLSIAFGPTAYARAHRVWGHNLLVAGLAGLSVGIVGWLVTRSSRVQTLAARYSVAAPRSPGVSGVVVCSFTGMLAGLSHLPADVVFNGGRDLPAWPVPLLWPFDSRGWAVPVVPWGDIVVTLLFTAGMFALYRWPARDRAIAALTLAAASAYLLARWILIASGN